MAPNSQEDIRPFVIAAHSNLELVKMMLEQNPDLLNTCYEEWNETPLGAASHVGNKPIAEYLLAKGAPLTICTAAMLGNVDAVRAFIQSDPASVNARGAHGIHVLVHAAMSGKIELMNLLEEAGVELSSAGHALLGAVSFGDEETAAWLLERRADPNLKNFQGKTSLDLAQDQNLTSLITLVKACGGKASVDLDA